MPAGERRVVYDCFPFLNEVAVVWARLTILAPVVDHVVVVEARQTFGGAPHTPLFGALLAHDERFAPFRATVRYTVVDTLPPPGARAEDQYDVEDPLRARLADGYADAPADALILISDADEIPAPAAVTALAATPPGPVAACAMRAYYYGLNRRARFAEPWLGTRAGTPGQVTAAGGPGPFRAGPGHALRDAGWTYAFFGPEAAVREKVEAWHPRQFPWTDPVGVALAARRAGMDWNPQRRGILEEAAFTEHDPALRHCRIDWLGPLFWAPADRGH